MKEVLYRNELVSSNFKCLKNKLFKLPDIGTSYEVKVGIRNEYLIVFSLPSCWIKETVELESSRAPQHRS